MVRISNGRSISRRAPRRSAVAASRARRKFLEKRLAILRAAAAAFRERGLAATGMREIAEAADLSAANLYHYFASKDEILYFCQDHALDRMLEACDEVRSQKATLPEKLRQVIEAQILCMLDEVDGAGAHLMGALPGPLRKKIVAKRDRYEKAVRRILQQGMKDGAFATGDATLLTRAILGAVNWTAQWYSPGGARSPESIAQEFARYLVRGLTR